jgi:hypothetical protein
VNSGRFVVRKDLMGFTSLYLMGAYEQPFVAGATKGCLIEGWGGRALIPLLPAGRGEGLTLQIQTREDFLQGTGLGLRSFPTASSDASGLSFGRRA